MYFAKNHDLKCYLYVFCAPGVNGRNKKDVLAQFPILNQVKKRK